jgi:hypothetical protein
VKKRGEFDVRMFVTLLCGGVHLMLANPAGVNYESHAEKIPGDKKHVGRILSQSH